MEPNSNLYKQIQTMEVSHLQRKKDIFLVDPISFCQLTESNTEGRLSKSWSSLLNLVVSQGVYSHWWLSFARKSLSCWLSISLSSCSILIGRAYSVWIRISWYRQRMNWIPTIQSVKTSLFGRSCIEFGGWNRFYVASEIQNVCAIINIFIIIIIWLLMSWISSRSIPK